MTKKLKKTTAFLSAVAMVMAMLMYFPSGTFNIDFGLKASAAETITPTKPEGDGSEETPYQIGTAEELYWFAACVNGGTEGIQQNKSANAVLTADITVNSGLEEKNGLLDSLEYGETGEVTNGENFTSWTPIGNNSNRYTGRFDGQNHTISGLYFNSITIRVGLFGYVGKNGSVSNVGVVDSYFKGDTQVGGVCGLNDSGTITNCYNTGAVSGRFYVGGVCANNYSYSSVKATITNCYNTGAVSGTNLYVGGVCGYNYSASSGTATATITNCYNTGEVSGSKNVGGVCGYNYSTSGTATITNCYNTGAVSGTDYYYVGGVCGSNYDTITNCYYLAESETDRIDGTTFKNSTDFSDGIVCELVGYHSIGLTDCKSKAVCKLCSTTCSGDIHILKKHSEVKQTCTEDGTEAYWECTKCNKLFSDVTGNTVISTPGTLSKTGHSLTEHPQADATCTSDGTKQHWHCSVCGKNYSDSQGTTEITDTVIPCGHTLSKVDGADATCTSDGTKQHWHCSVCGKNYSDSQGTTEITDITVPQKEHSYVNGICTLCGGYDPEAPTHSEHNYNENGFCTDCGGYEPATLNVDVYEISNAGQLYWFAACVNGGTEGIQQNKSANAVLTADITVNEGVLKSDGTLNNENIGNFTSWTPIVYFGGTFDGQNHTVSGLYFNSSTDYVGLFGYSGGTIKNVGVVDSYFNGKSFVGGVCGWNNHGTISNCYNTGSVTGGDSVGGVCGYNCAGIISNCYNTGDVSGTGDMVGGVCGYNEAESGGTATIENCYNTGAVSGNLYVGGVCGYNHASFYGIATIKNCYNTGEVSGTGNEVGGVCGYNFAYDGIAKITKCYYLEGCNAVGTSFSCTEGTSKSSEQFESGEVCGLITYHSHQNGICALCGEYEPATLNVDVYEISNAGQLYWFADKVNNDNGNFGSANAVLTANITVNTGDVENAVANCKGKKAEGWIEWTPIGNDSNPYTGTFDGQGYTISGLYFDDANKDYVGLFGYSSGTIKNVGVVDSYFKGKKTVGGVCGWNSSGTITDCYNTGAVNGSGFVGGVCAVSIDNTITNCYNTGTVSGSSNVGGVCGLTTGGTIANCFYDSYKYSGNAVGFNYGTVSENVLDKDTTQFTSGEVAYLLSQGCTVGSTQYKGDVWGQDLSVKNSYPVLGGKKVLANSDNTKFANDIIIYGQSATLDGMIGMNIYVAADDNYEWSASFNDVVSEKPVKDENGLYKFTCNVAAKDMEQEIVFSINGEEKAKVTVKAYLEGLKASSGSGTPTPETAKLVELVDAMETYGNAADAFFKGDNVDPVDSVTAENLSDYEFTKNDALEGISYYGSSLLLKSETTVRHYFKLEEGHNISEFAFTVKVGDAEYSTVTPVEKSGYYYIDIENISADKLGTKHTVKINETTVISNYSALSYAKTVLEKSDDSNLQNLVKTLYLYNQKATALSGTQSSN